MGKLIFVPIERLEERYSSQWYSWFMRDFNSAGISPLVVGDNKQRVIENGQFLDVFETNEYKASQMLQILKTLKQVKVDCVFFMDLWFPSIQMLSYVRDAMGLDFKICGMLHAGTWDNYDFISQKKMAIWAKNFEKSVLTIADEIYVATKFHKQMIERYFYQSMSKIKVVPYPVFRSDKHYLNDDRKNVVVFPHRIAPEKQPELFEALEAKYRAKYNDEVEFVRTKDVCFNKDEYYNLLSESKVVFSSALQETFGIAMLEGVSCGCQPVAPNRLSYRETLKGFELYDSIDLVVDQIHNHLLNYQKPIITYDDSVIEIVRCLKNKLS